MDSPSRPTDAQRWLRFQNVSDEVIPPFAVIGPQQGKDTAVDAIDSSSKIDFALRLGRPTVAKRTSPDAAMFYVNGSQAISPKSLGRCTQTGMLQALIGYPQAKPPRWGDGLAIDTLPKKTPFYLVPGEGAYKFIDFDGCPQTTFKDKTRSGYQFRIGWIVPASTSTVLDGAIIKDSSALVTLSPGDIIPFYGRDNPELVEFGLSRRASYASDTQSLLSRGFYRVNTTGNYLLSFTARIRATESEINTNIPGNLTLICRTNRIGNTDEFYTADQVEALAADNDLDEESADYIFHKLRVSAEDQPADTNRVEGDTIEVHRHWQTVSGSTVLSMTEGELLFIYNYTQHEIEVSGVSGTLVLLSGASISGGGGTTITTSTSSSESASSSSAATTQLDGRVTSVEAAVTTQGSTISSHSALLAAHATSIAASATAISANADNISANTVSIANHEARIGGLETFETTATAAITANSTAIAGHADDIATSAAAIAAHTSDLSSLDAFQTATQAIFAGAIADGTFTTATGDEIATADGVVTSFTPGPVALPSTAGTNTYFLQTNGDGTTAWAKAIHQNWLEVSGNLRPDTNNVRDIGTASIKPRNLYLAGNATIDGSLTLSGVNIVNYMNSIGLVAATNSGDIDALQASFAAAIVDDTYTTASGDQITLADGLVTGFTAGSAIGQPYGFRVSNNTADADHDLDIAEGACMSWDRSTWLAGSAMTKRLDAAWASGSGNGGLDTGSMPTSGVLYLYAIFHPSSGVDYIGSTTGPTTGPSLPSGYTKYAYLGGWPTDSSASFEPIYQRRSYFERIEKTITTTDTNPGTSPVTKTVAAPMRSLIDLHIYFSHTGSNLLDIVHGDYTPAAGTPTGNIRMTNGSGNEQAVFRVGLSDSRQFRYDTTSSDGSTIVQVRVNGWFDMMLDPNLGA